MPIYCDELNSIIKKWKKITSLKKPVNSPASFVAYNSLMKFAKKELIENILCFLQNIAKKNIQTFTIGNYEIIIIEPKSKL